MEVLLFLHTYGEVIKGVFVLPVNPPSPQIARNRVAPSRNAHENNLANTHFSVQIPLAKCLNIQLPALIYGANPQKHQTYSFK